MFDFTTQDFVALLTLTALEIVLGIDNVIFIAILAAKLPLDQQARARTAGIGLAVITRVLLLLSITWIMRLTAPLFTILTWRSQNQRGLACAKEQEGVDCKRDKGASNGYPVTNRTLQ